MNDTGRFWSLVPIRHLDVAHVMDDVTGFLAEFHRVFWFSQIFQKRFRA